MRMMMKVCIPTAAGNKGIKDGSLPRTVSQFCEQMKPEGAYFTTDQGMRTAFFFFDLKDTVSIPMVAESFFNNLDAQISIQPCMDLADMQTGVGRLAK